MKLNLFAKSIIFIGALVFTVGCNSDGKDEDKSSLTEGGMKCGAGKCGASMVDGNTIVAKKKKNILSQMRKDDPRKDCVLKAGSNKALYDCIRDPKTKHLTTKCGMGKCSNSTDKEEITMKCGAGKCGTGMSQPKVPPKPEPAKAKPAMKCSAGKCGGK